MQTMTVKENPIIRETKKDWNVTTHSIINEAVNIEKQVIFVSISKNGTNTVRSQIRQEGTPLVPYIHLNIMQIRDLIYFHMLMNNLAKNREFPTTKGFTDLELRQHAKEQFDRMFKFSAVRNPWARAVSIYFRREGVRVKDKISFEVFCDKHYYSSDTSIFPTIHKNQLDWLCDERGKCIMDYVYKVENFSTAIEEIKERTNGRLDLKNIQANKNPHSPAQNYRELYSDKTRKIIAKRFEKDIDFFKYAF